MLGALRLTGLDDTRRQDLSSAQQKEDAARMKGDPDADWSLRARRAQERMAVGSTPLVGKTQGPGSSQADGDMSPLPHW